MASLSREQLTEGVEYKVEVSFPQYFFLPSVVQIPLKEDARAPWQNLAGTNMSMNASFTASTTQIYTCTYRLHEIKWGNKSSFSNLNISIGCKSFIFMSSLCAYS